MLQHALCLPQGSHNQLEGNALACGIAVVLSLARPLCACRWRGADMIKLGYVSRQHIRDNFHHALLGTQARPPAAKKSSGAIECTCA